MKRIIKYVLLVGIPLLILAGLFFFLYSSSKKRTISRPVVTVINPIRGRELGLEKADLLKSLQGQWQVSSDTNTRATWLWQYSALEDKSLTNFAISQMKNQEFGIFLEIDRNLSQKANVLYRGRGPWYFSDGLLLVSYDESERKKLIDTAFQKFKKIFGYYPRSVGAWWIGSDSLNYMQRKYAITGALRAAEQYDLDVYSIWGTPWSIPYIPSRENEGIPAGSTENSTQVVIMQWAARDPTRAYGGTQQDSLYSLQDYESKKYDLSYFNYLSNVYLKQPFDQIVVGLESGLPPGAYQTQYKDKLLELHKWERQRKVVVATAGEYAEKYLERREIFPPTRYFLTKAYDSEDQSFWFHSKNYRASIQKKGESVYLVDLRDYSQSSPEDFSLLPNSQGYLRITTPAIIDSARFPHTELLITKNKEPLQAKENKDGIILFSGNKKIAQFTQTSLQLFGSMHTAYAFQPTGLPITIFSLTLFLYLLYFVFIFFKVKKNRLFYLNALLLIIPLLIAYLFLHAMQIQNPTFLFDRKEFFLLNLPFPYLSPSIHLIVLQTIPFLLLLITHYLYIKRLFDTRIVTIFYFLVLVGIILLYAHVPYFPLKAFVSGKTSVILYILFFAIILLGSSLVTFFVTRSRKLSIIALFSTFIFFIAFTGVIFLSRQRYIIAPFEMEALNKIANQKKNVLFILPKEESIYKAVVPLLYENPEFGERLTNVQWQELKRPQHGFVEFTKYRDSLIVIPRYIGSEIFREEIEKYRLVKIFDNAQIAIYKTTNIK